MRYIPHTDEDRRRMLAEIGARSVRELFRDIPDDLYIDGPLSVPAGLDEHAIFRNLSRMASQNANMVENVCFLGAGIYDHFVPSIVPALFSRGEFLTAYTPYQPEVSQGLLQSIFEFQSMICALTGMDVCNASMYDAATALAEAGLMACNVTGRNRIVCARSVHPHYREVTETYLKTTERDYVEVENVIDVLDDRTAAVLVQYPNFFGNIDDLASIVAAARSVGALAVVSVNPISLGVLKPPSQFGFDIVVGEGQTLGLSMNFGGPLLGFFACKQEHIRKIPGRIVGETTDVEGRRGFVMTLRAREQDIRREKATSNICTNEALCALAATIYMASLGKHGITAVAETCAQKAHYAAERLSSLPGCSMAFPDAKFFNEFALRLPIDPTVARDRLLEKSVLAGLPLGDYYPELRDCLLVAVTETRTREEIDRFASELGALI
ncbi:MAG: aminomethyl-transferring glycine dehydrogenase subunit GcvPA [Armatimonadetes bacterium]|nr:aminomethyl-transferring glycine dehydrogenase subunit GcvPA [Armatimonadota bacterium]